MKINKIPGFGAVRLGIRGLLINVRLFYFLKIGGAVLAQRAYDIVGQLVALINPAANLANKAFFALGLRLGLNIVLIIGVGHCLFV